MKALLGKFAKVIKNDPAGNRQLREFIQSSTSEPQVIILSDGSKFRVSTSPINKESSDTDKAVA